MPSSPAPSQPAASQSASSSPQVSARLGGSGLPVLALLTLLAGGLNYASSVIFSRVLDPVGFGDLTSLLALGVIISVPTTAGQTVVAERVAFYATAGRMDIVRYLVRHGVAHVGALALAGTGLYALSIPLVVEALHLRVPGPAIALTGVVFFGFLTPFALGVLQGLDRLVLFGVLLVGISLARIGFGVGWAALGGGAGGAIAGQAIGMFGVVALSARLLRGVVLHRGTGAASSGFRRLPNVRAVTASAAFIAFAVISNLDLLLAKAFLTGHQVGIYAAIATVGKIVTFMPSAIAVALVPNAARAHAEGDETTRVLRRAALLVVATAAIAAIPVIVVPGLLIHVMFGPGYGAAESGLLPIVFAGAALAMLNLLVVYSVAVRNSRWSLLLAVGVAVQVIGVVLFHHSPRDVALVQAVATTSVVALNELHSHALLRGRHFRR
jgi:O-antigen/teichoic acid export membrane protein